MNRLIYSLLDVAHWVAFVSFRFGSFLLHVRAEQLLRLDFPLDFIRPGMPQRHIRHAARAIRRVLNQENYQPRCNNKAEYRRAVAVESERGAPIREDLIERGVGQFKNGPAVRWWSFFRAAPRTTEVDLLGVKS